MVPFLPNFNTYFLQNVELWSFQNQWHFAYIEQWEILIKEAYLESYCSQQVCQMWLFLNSRCTLTDQWPFWESFWFQNCSESQWSQGKDFFVCYI
jgi:hypothetical protein